MKLFSSNSPVGRIKSMPSVALKLVARHPVSAVAFDSC